MLTPLGTDVRMGARPWANWAIILLTVLMYCTQGRAHWDSPLDLPPLALDGPGIGIVGHVLVHADVVHLAGNMLFLWVFGNAVAPRLGLIGFPCFYFAAAAFVGVTHLLISDQPAVGASGAINAVVGVFLVVHPKDRVRTLLPTGRVAEVPGYVAVLVWLAFDLWGLSEETNVGHSAHLLGFLFGFVTAVVLIRTRRMPIADFEATLLDLPIGSWLRGKEESTPSKARRPAPTNRPGGPGRPGRGK